MDDALPRLAGGGHIGQRTRSLLLPCVRHGGKNKMFSTSRGMFSFTQSQETTRVARVTCCSAPLE